MLYNVSFSDEAFEEYIACVEYLLYNLESAQAANSLVSDVDKAINNLRRYAEAYSFCNNSELAKRGIRRIRLKHRYRLFYVVDGKDVTIVAMLHNLQDFEARLI